MENKNLCLIAGARGKLGSLYLEYFSHLDNFDTIGISSSYGQGLSKVNLLNAAETKQFIDAINFKEYKSIFLIHSIGHFKFETNAVPDIDDDGDGIDDDVYRSNLITFTNISDPLLKRVAEIESQKPKISFCAFGSISDRFLVPWWRSYSLTKNKLREYIHSKISDYIRGVFINVGSTEKEDERLFAEKTYWLQCKDVLEKSIQPILNESLPWQEIDLFVSSPNYFEGYFRDHPEIFRRWIRDMYGKLPE